MILLINHGFISLDLFFVMDLLTGLMLSAMIERLNGIQRLELQFLAFRNELVENRSALLEHIGIDHLVVKTARAHRDDESANECTRLTVNAAELVLDLVKDALVLFVSIR